MSFITGLTRMWLTRTAKPFTFKNGYDQILPYAECENLGLYVHIPFCKSICNFCPYCKVRYSAELCDRYIDSLIQEIHIVGSQHAEHRKATSLYFGGGTPALAANRIKEIVNALSEHFIITEGIGLELHPDNVNVETLQMLAEIEAGHVEVVITKDLSRLGRNSSLTGLYINYTFPQYGVRYIAINDHFDTIDPNSTDSDMAGIKNWFNEWYSKDTSRKIRAVNKAKGERGERLTTNVPYGYKRDPDDPKKWVIDEEAAQIVKRIFALCMEGKGPSQIAALLEKEKVLNPTAYKQREGRKTPHQTPENEYRWHESTVAYILEYMEYTGCTVNFKTYTNSIWDKKQRENPMENRKIFYNTHPAIISLEVFDKVQEIRQQRHRRTATGKSNMFSGLVFCNDCKQKLYYSTTSYFEKRQDFFICSTHRVNKDKCSGHYIRAVVLEQIVWKHIQEVISVVTRYEAYFRSEMEQKLRMQSEESLRLYRKRLAQAEKRIGELDRLFIRIYEDNAAGRLDDERFAMMSKNYTEEQKDLKAEVKGLQQQIHEQEQQAENIEQFVQRVKRNSTLTELTPYALRELVKAVYVNAPDKSSGKRRQKVHIEYDLVGYIPVDELLKAEQA